MIEAMSKWSVLVVSPYIVCPIVCVPLSTSSSELVKRHGVFQEAFRWLSIITPLALRCQSVSRLGTAFSSYIIARHPFSTRPDIRRANSTDR